MYRFPKKLTFKVDHPTLSPSDEHDLSYIHALPPEVLQEIFYQEPSSFISYQIVDYYRTLFSIRSVCKYWKEVIDTTPRLWTGITSFLNQNILAMALRNSGAQPLYVHYAGYPDGNDAKLKLFLAPSAERWDRLGYRWTYDSNPQHEVLSLPLRSLRYLKINGTYGASHKFPLDAPLLETLAIRSFSLDWATLSGLRFLRIVETPGPSTAELLSLLEASPQLEYLMLRETRSVDSNPDFLPSPVHLPQLKDLSIISLPIHPLSYILDQIEAPSLQWLVCKEDGSSSGDLTLAIRSAGRHIGTFSPDQEETAVELWVCFQREMFRFAIGGRVVDYWGTGWNPFTGGRRLAHLAAFGERIDNNLCQEVQVLTLEGEPYDESAECLHILHQRFPQIQELVVKDTGEAGFDSGEICEQLSSPALSEGAGGWLFPNLTRVRFDGSVELAYERIILLLDMRRAEEQTKTITQLKVTGALEEN
ncbi:hypothetical protein FRC00_002172 [Tulasnella sp. 408]|nr:hypothetical protein FRC00_002172 [Tulasnella sp. 408]